MGSRAPKLEVARDRSAVLAAASAAAATSAVAATPAAATPSATAARSLSATTAVPPAPGIHEPCRLDRDAFNRPTLRVARELLGKFIVRSGGGPPISAMITEVEAYIGPRDLASHARNGRRTARVEPLYGDGGTVYVYFVYGMHWLLNFSTAGAGKPEAVLIRAILADLAGGRRSVVGPARVTRHLGIDKQFDGTDATRSERLWIEDRGVRVPRGRIRTGPRVGIDYAGSYWAARPWRFWIDFEAGGPRSPAKKGLR